VTAVDDKIQRVKLCELSAVIITKRGISLLGGCVIKLVESHYCVHKSQTHVHIRKNKDTIRQYTTLYSSNHKYMHVSGVNPNDGCLVQPKHAAIYDNYNSVVFWRIVPLLLHIIWTQRGRQLNPIHAIPTTALTFWCRNYFFNFSTPCI